MTVADLERYFRALSDALSSAGGSATRDLSDVADRLVPFRPLSVATFGDFLSLAWEYKTTGSIPVAVDKPQPTRRSTTKTPKTPSRTPDELLTKVRALYDSILDSALSREQVEGEIRPFESLTKPQLEGVALNCGFSRKFKSKPAVLEALIGYVLGRRGAFERADA